MKTIVLPRSEGWLGRACYRLGGDCYLDVLDPRRRRQGPTLLPYGTVIAFDGEPNAEMRPLNLRAALRKLSWLIARDGLIGSVRVRLIARWQQRRVQREYQQWLSGRVPAEWKGFGGRWYREIDDNPWTDGRIEDMQEDLQLESEVLGYV